VSNIQWTDKTVNPIHLRDENGSHSGHWCRKVSPGCENCYSELQNQAAFFPWASHMRYSGDIPHNLVFDHAQVESWATARKPTRRFVCSMTDLFGEWVSREWQFAVFDGAAAAPRQTIQLLTKRPAIAVEAVDEWLVSRDRSKLPGNIWMGVSVEDQARADRRVSEFKGMRDVAEILFVSYEPALQLVNWSGWEFIDWLIIGGESGAEARVFHADWARVALQWCRENNVAPFVKQLGSFPVCDRSDDAPVTEPIKFEGKNACSCWVQTEFTQHGWSGDKYRIKCVGKGGNPEEWPLDLRVREFPVVKNNEAN